MLYIRSNGGNVQWHVGMPVPPEALNQRVVTFQADGDELSLFLSAMKGTQRETPQGESG